MTDAQKLLMKACMALYAEVPESVANSVKKIAQAVIDETSATPQQGITLQDDEIKYTALVSFMDDDQRTVLSKDYVKIFTIGAKWAASQFKGYSREQMEACWDAAELWATEGISGLHDWPSKAEYFESLSNSKMLYKHMPTGQIGTFVREYPVTGRPTTMQIQLYDGRIYFAPSHEFKPV